MFCFVSGVFKMCRTDLFHPPAPLSRTRIADPAFMKGGTTEIARLLTKEFGQLIAANVTDVSSGNLFG